MAKNTGGGRCGRGITHRHPGPGPGLMTDTDAEDLGSSLGGPNIVIYVYAFDRGTRLGVSGSKDEKHADVGDSKAALILIQLGPGPGPGAAALYLDIAGDTSSGNKRRALECFFDELIRSVPGMEDVCPCTGVFSVGHVDANAKVTVEEQTPPPSGRRNPITLTVRGSQPGDEFGPLSLALRDFELGSHPEPYEVVQ